MKLIERLKLASRSGISNEYSEYSEENFLDNDGDVKITKENRERKFFEEEKYQKYLRFIEMRKIYPNLSFLCSKTLTLLQGVKLGSYKYSFNTIGDFWNHLKMNFQFTKYFSSSLFNFENSNLFPNRQGIYSRNSHNNSYFSLIINYFFDTFLRDKKGEYVSTNFLHQFIYEKAFICNQFNDFMSKFKMNYYSTFQKCKTFLVVSNFQ